jgi:hypothetical protein
MDRSFFYRALFQNLAIGVMNRSPSQSGALRPAGVGKSWLASALGDKASRDNRSALYHRVPKLFEDLARARGDGRPPRIQHALGRADPLVLDD